MSDKQNIRFLLGSNTKRGFIPLFDELREPVNGKRLYIIKGGPGSGKSSLMKKIAAALEEKKHSIEYFHCASDPGSLDAFIDYDAKIAMMDGTAPHTMDPEYPGAYDVIINMADCWDDTILLENKGDIIPLSDTISTCHRMASGCIRAAAALLDNNMQLATSYVNHDTIYAFTSKLLKKLNPGKAGKEKKRLLSAVSVGETVFFGETMEALAGDIYVLPDMWGAASNLLLSELNRAAAALGIERIICYCSIRTPDKIDHIILPSEVPSEGIAVTTANPFHSLRGDKQHIVEDLMHPIPKFEQEQMSLHLDMAKELIDIAGKHVQKAKLLHDDLEAFYIKAMDFSRIDTIYEKIMQEILN